MTTPTADGKPSPGPVLSFGRHKGEPLTTVPTSYLDWCLRTVKLSTGLRLAVADELRRRGVQTPALPLPPPRACHRCGSADVRIVWHQHSDGRRQTHGTCQRCGGNCGAVPMTPENGRHSRRQRLTDRPARSARGGGGRKRAAGQGSRHGLPGALAARHAAAARPAAPGGLPGGADDDGGEHIVRRPREIDRVSQCLRLLRLRGVCAWRQNTGGAYYGTGPKRRFVRFAAKGCSDILGCLPPSGRLLAVEAKQPGRQPAADQQAFLAAIAAAGGLAWVIRDVAELEALLTAASRAGQRAHRNPGRRRCGQSGCEQSGG